MIRPIEISDARLAAVVRLWAELFGFAVQVAF
jgi:hypothetical protein